MFEASPGAERVRNRDPRAATACCSAPVVAAPLVGRWAERPEACSYACRSRWTPAPPTVGTRRISVPRIGISELCGYTLTPRSLVTQCLYGRSIEARPRYFQDN